MSIRDAVPQDAAGLAQVRVHTWRAAYRGIIADATLDAMSVEAERLRWQERLSAPAPAGGFFLVDADDAGQVNGFCAGASARDSAIDRTGEVYALYVLPEKQGRGIGRALFEAAARRLRAHHFERLLVWVLAENPARRFYEKMGGAATHFQEIAIDGQLYSEVGYIWDTLDSLAGEILRRD